MIYMLRFQLPNSVGPKAIVTYSKGCWKRDEDYTDSEYYRTKQSYFTFDQDVPDYLPKCKRMDLNLRDLTYFLEHRKDFGSFQNVKTVITTTSSKSWKRPEDFSFEALFKKIPSVTKLVLVFELMPKWYKEDCDTFEI